MQGVSGLNRHASRADILDDVKWVALPPVHFPLKAAQSLFLHTGTCTAPITVPQQQGCCVCMYMHKFRDVLLLCRLLAPATSLLNRGCKCWRSFKEC